MRRQYDTRVTVELRALARALKVRRTALKLGLREAAQSIGVSAATLSRVERGYMVELHCYLLFNDWLQRGPFGAAPLPREAAL